MENSILANLNPLVMKCVLPVTVAGLGYLVIKRFHHIVFGKPKYPSYPPGPPRDFIIGALRSFPKGEFLERFCEWAETYGRY
jgi:hypothetical protein